MITIMKVKAEVKATVDEKNTATAVVMVEEEDEEEEAIAVT